MNSSHNTETSSLEWENYVALQAMQALLGLVTCRMRAVSLRASTETVTLFFAFDSCEAADREDVEEICFDPDVLLDGKVQIDSCIHIGTDDEAWHGYRFKRIYRAKR